MRKKAQLLVKFNHKNGSVLGFFLLQNLMSIKLETPQVSNIRNLEPEVTSQKLSIPMPPQNHVEQIYMEHLSDADSRSGSSSPANAETTNELYRSIIMSKMGPMDEHDPRCLLSEDPYVRPEEVHSKCRTVPCSSISAGEHSASRTEDADCRRQEERLKLKKEAIRTEKYVIHVHINYVWSYLNFTCFWSRDLMQRTGNECGSVWSHVYVFVESIQKIIVIYGKWKMRLDVSETVFSLH